MNLILRVLTRLYFFIQMRKEFDYDYLKSEINSAKISLISNFIDPPEKIVEFGSGGSTIKFLELGFKILSIETDRNLAKKINTYCKNTFGCEPVIYVNIGPTNYYGFPRYSKLFKATFNDYIKFPKFNFDLAFVDGRFRVATTIWLTYFLDNPPKTVIIDDFADRKEYFILKEIFPNLNIIQGMGVITETSINIRKKDIVKRYLLDYSLDPR